MAAQKMELGWPDEALCTLVKVEQQAESASLRLVRMQAIRLQGDCYRTKSRLEDAQESYRNALVVLLNCEDHSCDKSDDEIAENYRQLCAQLNSDDEQRELAHIIRGRAGLAYMRDYISLEQNTEAAHRVRRLYSAAETLFGELKLRDLEGITRAKLGRAELLRTQGQLRNARGVLRGVVLPRAPSRTLLAFVHYARGRVELDDHMHDAAATEFARALCVLNGFDTEKPLERVVEQLDKFETSPLAHRIIVDLANACRDSKKECGDKAHPIDWEGVLEMDARKDVDPVAAAWLQITQARDLLARKDYDSACVTLAPLAEGASANVEEPWRVICIEASLLLAEIYLQWLATGHDEGRGSEWASGQLGHAKHHLSTAEILLVCKKDSVRRSVRCDAYDLLWTRYECLLACFPEEGGDEIHRNQQESPREINDETNACVQRCFGLVEGA